MATAESAQTTRVVRTLEGVVVVVAALYFARPILVPLALAFLISFLLSPAVTALERRGLHRLAAIAVTVLLIFSAAALVASKTVEQLSDLVLNLPAYRQNLHDKLEGFRQSDSRALKELEKTVAEVRQELQSTSAKANEAAQSRAGLATTEPPLPVRLVANPTGPLDALQMAFFALAEPLAQAGFVVVLVIFMLASREDLRDRVIRLAGTGRITLTTRTLDELSTRISRYLLDSAIVNGGFGLTIGCGLYAIGVHYALLWGFLGGMLRFVPYLGPIAGSLMPIGMAIIQFPSWTQPRSRSDCSSSSN